MVQLTNINNAISEKIINDNINFIDYIDYNTKYPWKLNTTYICHNNQPDNIPEPIKDFSFSNSSILGVPNNYLFIESKTSDIKIQSGSSNKIIFNSDCSFNNYSYFNNIDSMLQLIL
jgi:hypothetical protein